MKKVVCIAVLILSMMFFQVITVSAQDGATTDDVYELILKAVSVLGELGEEGIEAFNDPKGEFVYKNAYVLVTDCSTMKMLAHPNNKLIGIDLQNNMDKNPDPAKRKYVNRESCELAQNPNGGWQEYYWNKPGSEEVARKVGFCLKVPETNYVLISAIYDDTADVEKLNASLK